MERLSILVVSHFASASSSLRTPGFSDSSRSCHTAMTIPWLPDAGQNAAASVYCSLWVRLARLAAGCLPKLDPFISSSQADRRQARRTPKNRRPTASINSPCSILACQPQGISNGLEYRPVRVIAIPTAGNPITGLRRHHIGALVPLDWCSRGSLTGKKRRLEGGEC